MEMLNRLMSDALASQRVFDALKIMDRDLSAKRDSLFGYSGYNRQARRAREKADRRAVKK
jgi:hypothetical protein